MADMYSSEEIFLRDYRRLNQEYKRKAERYIKDLLKLQRAENRLSGQICAFTGPVKKSGPTTDSKLLRCNFCGKSQEDVYRLISAPNVHICDECARLCVEIIDEQEKNDAQSTGKENQ